MAVLDVIQHSFSRGVISPELQNRTDLEFYAKSLSKAKNVIIMPEGSLRNRWGTSFIDSLPEGEVYSTNYKYTEYENYLIIFIGTNIYVYLDDVLKATVASPYSETMIANRMVQGLSTIEGLVITGDGSVPVKALKRGATSSDWTISDFVFKHPPSYDFKLNYHGRSITLSEVNVGKNATLYIDEDIFDSNYVGGMFIGQGDKDLDNEGMAYIYEYTDSRHVNVHITSEFSGAFSTGVDGTYCIITEKAFNSIYGYPTTVGYFESRVYFGGTPSLPSYMWGSKTNSVSSFGAGAGLSTDPVGGRLADHRFIHHINGNITLQVLTDESEYATILGNGEAIDPSDFSVRKMDNFGCSRVNTTSIDRQTFFVRSDGAGIGAFGLDTGNGTSSSVPISLFSSNLINNPVCLASFKGKKLANSNYVFIVNSDGTLAIYQTLQIERISAFVSADISNQNAEYKSVVTVGSDLYFVVERTISGTKHNYLEKADFDINLDCTKSSSYASPTTVITGLSYLEGIEVTVKGDGYLQSNQTVSGGQITLDKAATEVEIGLWSPGEIELLPFSANLQSGNNLYEKRRVTELVVDYFDTAPSTLEINGENFPEYKFHGSLPYDPLSELQETGFFSASNVTGWGERNKITIEQISPFNFTIIGVCAKLGV